MGRNSVSPFRFELALDIGANGEMSNGAASCGLGYTRIIRHKCRRRAGTGGYCGQAFEQGDLSWPIKSLPGSAIL